MSSSSFLHQTPHFQKCKDTCEPHTQDRVTVPQSWLCSLSMVALPGKEHLTFPPSSLTFLSPTNSFSAAVRLLISSSNLGMKEAQNLTVTFQEEEEKISSTRVESPHSESGPASRVCGLSSYTRLWAQKVLTLSLMLCWCHLEIFNDFF